ncbi:MAG: IS4 family transposase [Synechococcales cyanobacterium RM1_1_8]|nr:IS4 family transposase [Synechococcales cyanobacterium RM1_1_8]
MSNRAEILKQRYHASVGLPFERVLSESEIAQVLAEEGVSYRQVLYTPMVVLWAWISQVLDEDKSLSNAVKRVTTWLVAAGEEPPSGDTGGYSKARKRLPFSVLPPLLKRSADGLSAQVKPEQLWCGRRVKAYDGTSILMSDTAANQERYPQHRQKEGCGFPIAKVVVWFCVVTGAVLEVAMAPFKTSEWELSRQLYATLSSEDVVVADRAYGTYVDLALVQSRGADGVFRKHQSRKCDFRRGRKLGIGDHLVSWQRPQKCPDSMTREDFEALPTQLEVREVHLLLRRPGFRPTEVILVTTLLDPKVYPKAQLATLYGLRWQATEVNFKHLKTTLKMEMIAAKTPETVEKELWVHLLAYNLLRTLMWHASQQKPVSALRISLQGTRQQLNHFRPELARTHGPGQKCLYDSLLNILSQLLVPLRPNRAEPRVLKRRPKPFPRMQQPRAVLKAKLAA